MPKQTPVHRKRNSEIKKRYKELFVEGVRRQYVIEQIANEYYLTPTIISRILQPVKFGKRGGKIKTDKQHKEFMRAYNTEYRRLKRDKLMKSIELKINKNEH